MSSILPINLDDLLHCRGIESERVEFKASWDPKSTGNQVLKTICAFANDYHNLNGGYIMVGVDEREGRAEMPPKGLSSAEFEAAQKWIRSNCKRIDPVFQPILSPEMVDDRRILVIWVPASDVRPHRAHSGVKGQLKFWIRLGSETVDAETRGDTLRHFLEHTAKTPWDDRRAFNARVEELRETRVREFLRDVGSGLLDEPDAGTIYRHMRITTPVNRHEVPRNVGLLFFSNNPELRYRGAKIEVVQFAADRGGDVQEERTFSGPLHDQYRDCLNYLEGLSTTHLEKQKHHSRVRGWVSYPLQALRETLVNALYHRSYDEDQPEPIKVYLYPGRIEITSYPGPVPGIEQHHLEKDGELRPVPARNRRIGEFFKELKLAEGRLTGLAKVFRAMENNGSPPPRFEFNPERTYFTATLPAHPEYAALSALRDAAHLRALGDDEEAHRRLVSAWENNTASAVLTDEVIRSYRKRQDISAAEKAWETFKNQAPPYASPHAANTMIEFWLDFGEHAKADRLLTELHSNAHGQDAVDAAILARRLGNQKQAHDYFAKAGDTVQTDLRALHEFAQTKIQLSHEVYRKRPGSWQETNRRLLSEAVDLLERVVQMDASPTRHGWAWRDLARARDWLGLPDGSVEDAWNEAKKCLPVESRFECEYQKFKSRRGRMRKE